MLIAGYKVTGNMRLRREYRKYTAIALPYLNNIRDAIEEDEDLDLRNNTVGVRGWLLPPWYYRRYVLSESLLLRLVDFSADVAGHPTMVSIGEVIGSRTVSTGRPWSIGKGLIGSAVFEGPKDDVLESVIHKEEIANHHELSFHRFNKLAPEIRRNRTRKDMKALGETYGSALGIALRTSKDAKAFGCVTIDTPKDRPLRPEEISKCGDIAEYSVDLLVSALLRSGLPVSLYEIDLREHNAQEKLQPSP